MEKKNYQIKVAELSSCGASTTRIDLKLNSLEDCKKIIEIAKVVNWEINLTDGGLNEELVERSVDYQNFLNKETNERAAWIKSQNEKTERINASPKTYHSQLKLPDGCEIIYERFEANFKAHVSSKIQWDLRTNVICDKNSKALYVSEYTTKDGRVQVNKFTRDIRHLFGRTEHEIHPEIIRDIVIEYNEISSKIRNL